MVIMKHLRIIIALISCLSFAGRAAAQWNFLKPDVTLAQIMDHQVQDDDSGCCCDEDEKANEEGPPDDCCEDSCDASLCPICADQIVPSCPLASLPSPKSTRLLILEVSCAVSDGCRLGLERPPRVA